LVLVALLGLMGAGAASGWRAPAPGAPAPPAAAAAEPAEVALLSTNRRAIRRLGYVRMRVSARRAAVLRLFAIARRSSGGRSHQVTRVRRVRLAAGQTRRMRLALNPGGRRMFGSCRTLTVRPAGQVRRTSASRRFRAAGRLVAPDRPRCAQRGTGPGGSAPGGSGPGAGGGDGAPPEDISSPPENPPPLGELSTADADRCDFLDPSVCLYPFPNDHFTREDPDSATGRRLALDLLSMPRNRVGKPIDPSDHNRADGFSPGNLIVTKVPGLDSQEALERTGAVPITDMARSFDPRQPVVVIEADTGERQLIWAEVDANPENPADRTLIIRPGTNFEEGERYIVALRRLRNAEGQLLPPREEFRAYRDGIVTEDPAIEARRADYEEIFTTLGRAGIQRRDLYLAWDFTVASEKSLAGRMLHIRDDAFAGLGDGDLSDLEVEGASPTFQVTRTEDFTVEEDARIARRVEGNVVVPCYLDQPGCPTGSRFVIGPDGNPIRNPANFAAAAFICNIPRRAANGDPARPSLYGHGLLGSADQVDAGKLKAIGNDYGVMFCATDWAGFAQQDLPTVLTILQDLSEFPKLVDRTQQGFLNFLYLGRAMIHPQGFGSHPAFQFAGKSAIDTRRLFYNGGSQGGILGGALTAVAPDFDRAALGVPGMNYSTLLRRSVDFVPYAEGDFGFGDTQAGLYDSYPSELERPLILSLTQLLWDRGEANGYAHHMTTDPYPGTPPHEILMHEAFGDHQVANIATEVMARTARVSVREPVLDPGRSLDVEPVFGIPRIGAYPFAGSALVVWDIGPLRTENGRVKGTPPPPPQNVPNSEGVDPHGPDASETPDGQRQIAEFLTIDGKVVSVCGTRPCYLDGWTGP